MSQLKINQDLCIGCGLCVSLAPNTFVFSSETNKAEVIPGSESADSAEKVEQAIISCPVAAITRE